MSMHVSPVQITATIQIGATGAVSSFVGSAVQSVVRNSTGSYTIALQPQTNIARLISGQGSMQSPPSGLSGILGIEFQNAPNASVSSLVAPSITVKTLDAAGALADPASGSALNVQIIGNMSSVLIGGE